MQRTTHQRNFSCVLKTRKLCPRTTSMLPSLSIETIIRDDLAKGASVLISLPEELLDF